MVFQTGGIRNHLGHVVAGHQLARVLALVDGVEELGGSKQASPFGTYIGSLQTIILAKLKTEPQVPLLHVRNLRVLVKIVDRVDILVVHELAVTRYREVHFRKDERIIVQHDSSSVGGSIQCQLLRLRAQVGDGDAEQSIGGHVRDGVSAS